MALRQEEFTSLCDDVDLDRDRALVERCQAGDSAAFGNLYARYYERLLRFCLRRLNDRHEAEDAAQEAFARAWKALPRFAGDKRFYPWLTVIAGNICTDMLRRRSRSTPTDDMELTAQQPVGVVGSDTSEDLVLAAVDGELVNRALDRLSTRHRHVLAMREGSGWTYQQIADHEGVEIGTIETLLWRARQALKREFAVVSESKEALAGFLIATGALIKRTVFRVAHRSASVHSQSGGTGGGFRDGLVGAVAVTGAAVAAAFVVPHALSGPSSPPAGAGTALAAPSIASLGTTTAAGAAGSSQAGTAATSTGGANGSSTSGSGAGGTGGGRVIPTVNGAAGGASSVVGGVSNGASGVSNGVNQTTSGLGNTVNGVTNGLGSTVGGVTNGLGQTVTGATNGLGQTVNGVTNGLSNTVNGLTNTLGGLGGLLGSGSSGSGSGSGSTNTATTTTTTNPVSGVVGGLGNTVGGLTGGVGDTVGGLLGG
ncbi:MAG TPA: sigma-70 family RNA polymerase sigma factor [Acidimicrobiales bacterium]|nr:sigma-70 family RNA polymerase sigma factor [Acidimicrobiales bacterium]